MGQVSQRHRSAQHFKRERCADFLAQSILWRFHSHFVTKEIFEFPTDHTKYTLTLPLIGFELKSQQIKPLSKRTPFLAPSSCKPASILTVFN